MTPVDDQTKRELEEMKARIEAAYKGLDDPAIDDRDLLKVGEADRLEAASQVKAAIERFVNGGPDGAVEQLQHERDAAIRREAEAKLRIGDLEYAANAAIQAMVLAGNKLNWDGVIADERFARAHNFLRYAMGKTELQPDGWARGLPIVQTQQTEVDALEAFHPRAMKLMRKRKPFVVVAEDEPYFGQVYSLIRAYENLKGSWSQTDEQHFQGYNSKAFRLYPDEDGGL